MIRTFGCKVIFHIPKHQQNWKLAPTSEIGILLGFNDESAYRILKLNDKKVYTSRHVNFFENSFPTLENSEEPSSLTSNINRNNFFKEEEIYYNCLEETVETAPINKDHLEVESVFSNQSNIEPEPPARKKIKIIGPRHPTLINSDIRKTNILPYSRRPSTHLTHSDPCIYNEALKSDKSATWMEAVTKELDNMKKLDVWEEVPINKVYKLIGMTWVFKTKRKKKHEIHEHKARLCAQDFSQTHGIDFSKTFSPTGRLNSLLTLISHAASTGLRFEQLDMKSTFLNSPLEDKAYLAIPQGLDRNKRNVCLRLKKAIYGSQQAPLAWYFRLSDWLTDWGFKVSKADSCVFHYNGDEPIWLFIHIDDIGIFGKNLTKFKMSIEAKFSTKMLGLANLMLGIKITHEANSITLSQCHYIDALLDLYGMTNCKPVATALIPNTHLEAPSDQEREDFLALNVNYRSAIGSLSYLSTAKRPDLSFSVSALPRFLESPGIQHWQDFLHILKYLKGTSTIILTYCRDNQEPPLHTQSQIGEIVEYPDAQSQGT
ncbi:hypothetical protein O181_013173 [Austropuccinia psidii MF-1]|uniref:Reverse transcriptase Ty1/copia-type domain-containing protein n=1 Tax=Austropuccinia psidii MF-1 TaxID=1389203 RepID=A0A9Q3BYQ4_9BASI|nr:hypothetical protein [Austropuccinia psidii MF-1]